MPHEVNIHIKTPGADKAKQDIDEVTRATKKSGDATSQAGTQARQASGKMKLLGSAVNQLKSYLVGLAGISGLLAFFKSWLEHIKEITEAQDKLVESTKGLDQAAKSLASQANVMGVPGGMEAARQQVATILESGVLGSWEQAEAVAVAAHSAFGTSGQLLTPEQLDIAGVVAGFAQRKDVSDRGIDDLFKVLDALGATGSAEAAQHRISQLSTVQQASKIKDFELFISSAIKSIVPAIKYGATPEMAMAQFASALDVSASGDLAAQKTEQAAALMQNPKIVEAVSGAADISAVAFRDLPYDQRISLFSNWIAANAATGAGQQRLLKAGLSPEQLGRMLTLYNRDQLPRVGMFYQLAGSATAQQLVEEAAGYAQTVQGQIEAEQSLTAQEQAKATAAMRLGKAVKQTATARWTQIKSKVKESWLISDTKEKADKTLLGPLRRRYFELEASRLMGELSDEESAQLDEIAKILAYERPLTPWSSEPTAAGIGQAELSLRQLEGSTTINNNYAPTTIYNPIIPQDDTDLPGPRAGEQIGN